MTNDLYPLLVFIDRNHAQIDKIIIAKGAIYLLLGISLICTIRKIDVIYLSTVASGNELTGQIYPV